MARVTVEDCVEKIPNRFDLVMMASQRSRDIANGSAITVERDDDKNPVVSLREIAEEKLDTSELQDELIRGMQRYIDTDELEEDEEGHDYDQTMIGASEMSGMSSADSLSETSSEDPSSLQVPQFEDVMADD